MSTLCGEHLIGATPLVILILTLGLPNGVWVAQRVYAGVTQEHERVLPFGLFFVLTLSWRSLVLTTCRAMPHCCTRQEKDNRSRKNVALSLFVRYRCSVRLLALDMVA